MKCIKAFRYVNINMKGSPQVPIQAAYFVTIFSIFYYYKPISKLSFNGDDPSSIHLEI